MKILTTPLTLSAPLALGAVLALGGCDDPTEGKPTATVTEPTAAPTEATATPVANPAANDTTPETTAPKANAPSETIALSPENTKINFTGSKVTGSHEGGFKELSGTATLVAGDIKQSKVEVTIQTASLYADEEKLTGHLKSADFFDVEKIPTATFTSKSIEEKKDGENTHLITGDLTLHGVTKTISFPAKITLSDKEFAANSEFVINRKDFGIVYPGMPDDLIKDNVVIKLALAVPRTNVEG